MVFETAVRALPAATDRVIRLFAVLARLHKPQPPDSLNDKHRKRNGAHIVTGDTPLSKFFPPREMSSQEQADQGQQTSWQKEALHGARLQLYGP